MSKVTQGTAKDEVLDPHTLKKLKQHNRSIYQQRKEDAVALRQKLEEWKEEKRKRKMLEQKKVVAPFVTTVVKPPKDKPGEVAKAKPMPRKSLCGPGKGPSNSKAPILQQAAKPVKKVAVVKGRPRPLPPAPSQRPGGKENKKGSKPAGSVTGSKKPGHGEVKNRSGPVSSKLSASEVTTPLSHNAVFGKRHTIVKLTDRAEKGQGPVQPLALADELQAALRVGEPAVDQNIAKPVGLQNSEAVHGADDAFTEAFEPTEDQHINATCDDDSSTDTKTKHAPRDSLTSQFRKSKHQSNTAKKLAPKPSQSVPRSFAAKTRLSRKSVHVAKSTTSNPPRSILKRKSCGSRVISSAVGASPVLAAAPSSYRKARTPVLGVGAQEAVLKHRQVVNRGEETPTVGHVTFAVQAGKSDGEGPSFRRTPGKSKTQEYMRMKLNEWLVAKGRTPTQMRHAGCFCHEGHCSRPQTPMSHVKASMSIELLSKQENALAKEDALTKTRRLTSTMSTPTPVRGTPKPNCSSHNSTRKDENSTKHEAKTADENGDQSMETSCHDMDDDMDTHEEMNHRAAEGTLDRDTVLSPGQAAERAGLGLQADDIDRLNSEFQKCLAAIKSGLLGAEGALEWLDLVSKACSDAHHHAGWYKCQVAALKKSADEDALLAVFEQAIINNAQPAEEMAQLLTSTMKELLLGQKQNTTTRRVLRTRSSTRSASCSRQPSHKVPQLPEVLQQNVFESTTVKYSVKEVTPFKKRRRATEGEDTLIPVVTPVRRSARFSSSRTMSASEGRVVSSTPHVIEYSALEEVPSEEKEHMLFQPNHFLEPLLRDASPEGENLSMDLAE